MYEHVKKLIAMYEDIVAFADSQDKSVKQFTNRKLQFKIAKMLYHIVTTFEVNGTLADANVIRKQVNETELAAMRGLFDIPPSEMEQLAKRIPPTLLEVVIPVAIVRYMIVIRKMDIDVDFLLKVNNKEYIPWAMFSNQYMMLLLRSI